MNDHSSRSPRQTRRAVRRSLRLAGALVLGLAGTAGLTTAGAQAASHPAGARPGHGASVTPMINISSGCKGGSAEVEEVTAAPGYVYADWIGCGGIGFARSTDGGLHFSKPVTVPGSPGGSWDPAIAAHRGNWGDRDFIAVSKTGTVYVTWDYGPSAAEVQLLCSPTGSCAYSAGDFNAVIQKSADGGKTWGPITHVEPGFPLGGGYSAPLVVQPTGRIDVLYIHHPTDPGTLKVHPGHEFFTASRDGTAWTRPVEVGPGSGSLSLPEWWIDGAIATDAAGNLYATWDTQTKNADIGWLSFSSDGGRTWSHPVRVTPDDTT